VINYLAVTIKDKTNPDHKNVRDWDDLKLHAGVFLSSFMRNRKRKWSS